MNTTETLALFEQGKDAWNAWALEMLNEKEAIKTHEEDTLKQWEIKARADFRGHYFQDLRTTVTQVTILRGEFNFWLI